MKPVVKWAGGKSQSLKIIKEMLPSGWIRYYEPFLGGGALLLDFDTDIVSNAVVNDINQELINMYLHIRDSVEEVIKCLTIMDEIHERSLDPKDYYYKVRSGFNKNLGVNDPEQAARLIYLNKHCFNGLYRVNSKGEFNVPFNGKLTGRSFDPDHLREVSTKLKSVYFRRGDFKDAVYDARSGDFVFFDSPYAPLTPTSFTDYTKEGFSYEDHVRLADLFKDLTSRGVKCMLTNHDTDLIRDLYKDFTITEVEVSRNINRNGSDRKGKELIITNY
jgi:DNA adenine methylase